MKADKGGSLLPGDLLESESNPTFTSLFAPAIRPARLSVSVTYQHMSHRLKSSRSANMDFLNPLPQGVVRCGRR